MTRFRVLLFCLLLYAGRSLFASFVLPLTDDEQLQLAMAICRGTVLASTSYKNPADGHIYTSTKVRVDESFKGRFPSIVTLSHRGGLVDGRGEMDGFSPLFRVGEERLLFLSRRADETLFASQGAASAIRLKRLQTGAFEPEDELLLQQLRARSNGGKLAGIDVTDQAADSGVVARTGVTVSVAASASGITGLIVDGSGISARFLQADRGEPIPYLVDADTWPAGLTLNQALLAVQQAMAAWSAVTKLTFAFEGIQSFGMASANVTAQDRKIRIQLHDNYHYLPGGNILGIGGRAYVASLLPGAGWGNGGNVAGNEFYESVSGDVVLSHTNAAMRTLSTFTEVLCHEIGHVLSMAHSSENPAEANALLKQSIMYYQAHADGRGATLGNYDPPVIQQAYPFVNTPPFSFPRIMDIVTHDPAPPNIPGINEVQLRGYDRQTANPTLWITNVTANNGSFSLAGSTLKYVPAAPYSDSERFDPAGTSSWEDVYFRYSDGTNASAYESVRVLSYSLDTMPSPAGDGIPDQWMIDNFGSADPAAGAKRGANADYDGDGMTNLQEFILGSNPKAATSNLRITSFGLDALQFQAKPYELYEVLSSSNLSTWVRPISPIVPTNSVGVATGYSTASPKQFFRVLKVP